MTVEPGSREWTNYTGNPDDYPAWHDYHYRQRITDPAILRSQNVDPAYGGGGGGGYYSPETIRAGNLPPGSVQPPTASQQAQLAAQEKFLQSPTAQWASPEAYASAYRSYVAAGGDPYIRPAGIFLNSTLEERKKESAQYAAKQAQEQQVSTTPILTGRLQGSTGYDPYANIQGISKQEYLASRRVPDQYANLRTAAPLTAGMYERGAGLSAGLQSGYEKMIGYSPEANPVIKFASGAGSVITGLPAFVGMGMIGAEVFYRTPFVKLPGIFTKGAIGMGSELVSTAKARPIETAGMITALIAGPKIAKSVGGKIGEMVEFRGKTYVPPETIIEPQVLSGAERFPLAPKGTTGADRVTEVRQSKFELP